MTYEDMKDPKEINQSRYKDRELLSICLYELRCVKKALDNHLHHHEIYEVTIIGGFILYIICKAFN
jgi:hypothetical protein